LSILSNIFGFNARKQRTIASLFVYSVIVRNARSKSLSLQEEFEDTKGVIRIRKSKKNRQNNGQNKKDKSTSNDLQNIHIKLKIG